MRQINFGMILSLLLATLLLSSCSSIFRGEPEIKIVTKVEKTVVPIVPMPKSVQMNDVKIHVVSPEENFEEFSDRMFGTIRSTVSGNNASFDFLADYK